MPTSLISSKVGVRREWSGTEAPTGGEYYSGEKVWNENLTVNSDSMILLFWLCVESGSPGVWEPCYVSVVTPAL